MAELKLEQRHGKSRVRVARVWRDRDGKHHFAEWNVNISLLSDCLPAYISDDNSDIVATDTMKNTVYAKAKECSEQLSAEEFAILLAKHFTSFYQQVTAAIVNIVEKPWERISIKGLQHEHGFKLGSERHTTEVMVDKSGALRMTSGIEGLSILKTTKVTKIGSTPFFYITQNKWLPKFHITGVVSICITNSSLKQSGFEGFIRDQLTMLPETRERMMATEVTASWRYSFESLSSLPLKLLYFTERYMDVKEVLVNTFFGPAKEGVYSPSVQATLYEMAKAVLGRFPDISFIQLKMPNIHFLPVNLPSKDNPVMVKFADDVYLPTDEPHGTIQATLSRLRSKM